MLSWIHVEVEGMYASRRWVIYLRSRVVSGRAGVPPGQEGSGAGALLLPQPASCLTEGNFRSIHHPAVFSCTAPLPPITAWKVCMPSEAGLYRHQKPDALYTDVALAAAFSLPHLQCFTPYWLICDWHTYVPFLPPAPRETKTFCWYHLPVQALLLSSAFF